MEQTAHSIQCSYSDTEVNRLLESLPEGRFSGTRHFAHDESFFVRLPEAVSVPTLPIHHDVNRKEPAPEYSSALRSVVEQVTSQAPEFFSGLTHRFDPSDISSPSFYRIIEGDDTSYLYQVTVDLSFRPNEHTAFGRGTNDLSPPYTMQNLYLQADVIPLLSAASQQVSAAPEQERFVFKQIVDGTWIGETGRGYFSQGIWIDRDLTKFFSGVFRPKDARLYPWYPFTCRYQSLCHSLIDLSRKGVENGVRRLAAAYDFLLPHVRSIEASLREQSFSPELPLFTELAGQAPEELKHEFSEFRVTAYLNERDQKEYRIGE